MVSSMINQPVQHMIHQLVTIPLPMENQKAKLIQKILKRKKNTRSTIAGCKAAGMTTV